MHLKRFVVAILFLSSVTFIIVWQHYPTSQRLKIKNKREKSEKRPTPEETSNSQSNENQHVEQVGKRKVQNSTRSRPHILFIVADDMGWHDVGYHGSEIHTPQLDKLAREGLILNRSYVHPSCSPTRSAFLSGRLPYRIGMQRRVIPFDRSYGLPLNVTTIAQQLKSAGYSTHIVGKWHQGFCNVAYTPTERGFDTHFGFYVGSEHYFTHKVSQKLKDGRMVDGFDFRNNSKVVWNMKDVYSTHAFADETKRIVSQHNSGKPLFIYLPFQAVHGPLEVPRQYLKQYGNILDRDRRVYAGMMTAMDTAIGKVIAAFKTRNFWENTLTVFTTDNGGHNRRGANNYPLRGIKGSVWEGGTRGAAFVHGTMLHNAGQVSNELIHDVDWYPTFMEAAGMKSIESEIDGISMWKMLSQGERSRRQEIVYRIDNTSPIGMASIRINQWKLIASGDSKIPWWLSISGDNAVVLSEKDVREEPPRVNVAYLFDVDADPTERINLARERRDILEMMKARLAQLMPSYVDPLYNLHGRTTKCDPANFGGVWSPGWC